MKILQIVDVPYWAIGHLSQTIVEYNPHLNFKVLYVHPKHVAEHISEVEAEIEWADIVDFQYWNSARQLMEFLPQLKDKKCLLTHHNEKDLLSADWSDINILIAETQRSKQILEEKYPGKVRYIPLAIDLNEFTYKRDTSDHEGQRIVVGYAGRIVPWKGLKEIARACFELGYRLKIMGKPDKVDYMISIPEEHRAIMETEFMECDDNERVQFYHELDIFINNSGPGRETGTLPLMEAMASGVPLITTPSGIAADICEDHENAVVVPFFEYEELKANLKMLAGNDELREKIRRNAWQTIKNFSIERRAWEYEKVYHEIYSNEPLVSVIIPTTPEREDQTNKIITQLAESEYKHFEVILAIDQADDFVFHDRSSFTFTVKAVCTQKIGGYNLGMARNMAAIEAQGKYLMFCDNRMKPDLAAMSLFVQTMELKPRDEKVWLYGNKGTGKKSFVENFSFIRRDQFIKAGMCNERIDRYGGMSQELRERFQSQGFKLELVEDAIAEQISGSHMTAERRADIVASKLKLWKMGLV